MKIFGKVTDANTGDGIPYANVYFAKNKDGVIGPQQEGTITNEFGRYRLDWPADTWITASAVGYNKETKPLPYEYDSDQELNFELEAGIAISGVEIVAKKAVKKTKFWIGAGILAVVGLFWY